MNLNEKTHPVEVVVHRGAAVWKVARHALHQLRKTAVRLRLCQTKQVCDQPRPLDGNVALPAFAAARGTAARLMLTADRRPCSNRSISWLPGLQQQTRTLC